ncbi:MAG: 4Fe-4S binding protein, partial [Bacteroidales bacterium]|nr:4Fe-4S binding protein [Bacteroidales bacterium]
YWFFLAFRAGSIMREYYNRDYDAALLELTDILTDRNFAVIGAGAFVGQHSIFPKVGTSRPDESDLIKLKAFASECRKRLANDEIPVLKVKGKRPYKNAAGVPVHPVADKNRCKGCGECAEKCPAGAIDKANPTVTDTSKCISCGRCIFVCKKNARHYSGLTYSAIGALFKLGFSRRKEPEWS